MAYDEEGAAVRIVLQGEADAASVEVLQIALAGVAVDGARRVELDLSALEFIDVAALRHLTLFAMEVQQSGREVRTRGANPALVHLIEMVGAHDKLGLDGTGDATAL